MAHRRRSENPRAYGERHPHRDDSRRAHIVLARVWCVALASLAQIVACGGTPQTTRIDPREAVEQPFTFDPEEHGIGNVRPEVEEVLRQLRPAVTERDTQIVASPVRSDTTWTSMPGYRVQIFTSTTRELAEAEAMNVRQAFPQDSVYIIFQTPWHRVRIGDYRTRREAEEKLNEAKGKGFRDPFWVRSQIRVMSQ